METIKHFEDRVKMSTSMYAVFKQTHPPTGVEHSVYCNFYNMRERSLVIAGSSVLKVFRLVPENDYAEQKHRVKLEHMHTFNLFGNVICLEAVHLSPARDTLLLCFRDAKLSLVEYDPSTHDLKTVCIKSFEKEEFKGGYVQTAQLPMIRVDPCNRCAAMLIFSRTVAVIPFRKDAATDDSEAGIAFGNKPPLLDWYPVALTELEEKINNVVDMQFLHGYYEPTLLILYEPLRTWPGRIAIRQDTCCILALSLNLQQRVHPVIWSYTNLPFDCLQLLAVPRPLGGVLIMAVDSLLYLNQSVPPYGVSLNAFTEFSTSFPLKQQEGVKISLDCAQACFLNYDRLVLSLKGGELYVLTLFNDGMRSVRNFYFDKAAASVLTTSMTLCEDGYLFLGSRLGNSLLLHYTEKAADLEELAKREEKADGDANDPPSKKKRMDAIGDWMASDVALIDPDELEVYGSETMATKQLTSYTFEVCDSLINIGPCGKICMGEPAFLSEEFAQSTDPDLELVTTAGYGKNGALCVLQRSVRPQVVTTFELPGCVHMWTVMGPPGEKKQQQQQQQPQEQQQEQQQQDKKEETDEPNPAEKTAEQPLTNTHAFLILSRADSSMILQTDQEINELDHSGFSTQNPTVFAGNLGEGRYVLQVCPMGVRLLDGTRQLQHIPLDVGSSIVAGSLADPHVIIRSAEGLVIHLTLRGDPASGCRLAVLRPQLTAVKSKILSICVYKDMSGLFTTQYREPDEAAKPQKPPPPPKESADVSTNGILDDEDELLYGESEDIAMKEPVRLTSKEDSSSAESIFEVKEVTPTFWLFVARENGVLEIYSLPDYKLCFLVKNFPMGQKVLVDSVQMTAPSGTKSSEKLSDMSHESMPVVHEILVVGLGIRQSRPLLLARVDEDLLIYEAFPFYETQREGHLKLRFKKLSHDIILRARKYKSQKAENEEDERAIQERQWLHPFSDISGYSGIFLCGHRPHWLFMSSRGELRYHPMFVDGPIYCFAPFHNVNCPKGFLHFNKQGELRISTLPTHLTYDAPWPVRKVPLRCTPHFVNYHVDSKTYCVVTSQPDPCNHLVRFTGDEKEYELLERDSRYIFPTMDKFSLQLLSPVSWETIPNTRVDLDEWEHLTCIKNVMLYSEGTSTGMKGYLALGTNYCYGEDVTSRGRIIILDIIDVVPEPGQPLTKNKIKIVYSKEQKGPVTALSQVVGFLLSAIGQKVYIWQLKDNELVGVAFIDTQIYIHSVVTVKNLILVGDVFKSVSLLRYQEASRTLSLVSRDVRPLEVYAVEFFIDNTQMSFLVTDAERNLLLYMYQPESRESCGGQRLLRRGDFHVGAPIVSMFRIKCRMGDIAKYDRRAAATVDGRHITMFATLDGSLGYILPVPEKTYRRLLMLQNVLVTNIPHHAGLNPKAYRMYYSQRRYLGNPHKNILDGELIWKFLQLSFMERSELSKKIGTTVTQITDDLLEMETYTAHF
ncbi:cleavage and polyadenylation specificity factor subunit 1 isoform X1 [Haemaphysalis longicornis]